MYAPKILIAEDETKIRELVVKYLKKEGYIVYEAENGEVALDVFFENNIDLAIVDVMMPIYDGWSVCRSIREESQVPIIMLTARSEENDKVFGFEIGIDDYVTKPFSTKELMMRVKALLKRAGHNTNSVQEIGDMKIDHKAYKVYVNEEEIELAPKEFDLVKYFAENIGIALSRDIILEKVWGFDYFGDLRTVDTNIKRLRKKIDNSENTIETVRGVGYRFEVGT